MGADDEHTRDVVPSGGTVVATGAPTVRSGHTLISGAQPLPRVESAEITLDGVADDSNAQTLGGSQDRPAYAGTSAGRGAAEVATGATGRYGDDGVQAKIERGTPIGSFIVERQLGAGAMGVVLLARDPELARPVAIKLVASGQEGSDGHQRLLREAQAAARLSHPNVVAVHQAGTWNDQVFIVMEYVDGGTVREWVKSARPKWEQILDAFRQAAKGLAAAHAAGLVHRDFKPDNVLIGRDGRVRVSDFGLVGVAGGPGELAATVTSPDSFDVALTQTGAVLGTPAYMAPEQFEGATVDARADQFAFGVALFEALYGARPFKGDTPANLLFAVEHGEVAPPVASPVPLEIRRAIVRALAARPEARYPSMSAMLEALEWNPGESRRRTAGVATAVGAVALVTVAGVSLAVTRPWEADPRDVAEEPSAAVVTEERPDCEAAGEAIEPTWNEVRRTELRERFAASGDPKMEAAFARLDGEVTEYAAAWSAMRVEACTTALIDGTQSDEELDLRMACLEGRRADLESFVAVLSDEPAEILAGALAAVDKLAPLSPCADLGALRSLPAAPSDPELVSAIEGLRRQRSHARFVVGAGRYVEALGAATEVLQRARDIGEPAELARALVLAAEVNLQLTRPADAEPLAKEAIEVAAPLREHDVEADASIILLAATYGLGRYPEAKAMLDGVNAAVARAGQPKRAARVLFHEANLAYLNNELELALTKADAAIAKYEEAGSTTGVGLARAHVVRAATRVANSDHPGAHEDYDKARGLFAEFIGRQHSDEGAIDAGEALAYLQQGDTARAIELFRSAANSYRSLDPHHANAMFSLQNLGMLERQAGNVEAAEAALAEALEIGKHAHGETNGGLYALTQQLGRIYWETGRWREAGEQYAWGNRIVAAVQGEEALELSTYDFQQAELLQSQGDFDGSLPHIERALARYVSLAGEHHPATRAPEAYLGDTLAHLERCADANTHLTKAESIAERHEVAADPITVQTLVARSTCDWKGKRLDEALVKLDEATALLASLPDAGAMHPYAASVRARVLWALGRDVEARADAERAVKAFTDLGQGYDVYAKPLRERLAGTVE